MSEGHGKLLAGLPFEKQYWYAYDAIKKEWPISALDDAIKCQASKKSADSKARKSAPPTSPLERQLTERFGFPVKVTLNKNETGYFRIQFHDRAHMEKIMEKLGYIDENSLVQFKDE